MKSNSLLPRLASCLRVHSCPFVVAFSLSALSLPARAGFTSQTPGTIPGVYDSSLAWGDYDNDGQLDFVLTGLDANSVPVTRLFRNQGGVFTDSGIALPSVYSGAVAWGDYDNDGKLDLLLAGATSLSYPYAPICRLYHNQGNGSFVDSGVALPGVYAASVAWGDYNNDGKVDFVLTGWSDAGRISRIYRNEGGGVFVDSGIALTPVSYGSVAWGDFNNDGSLDLVLCGSSSSGRITRLYRNNGDGSFSDSGVALTGVTTGALGWGDYDNDGDLDLFLTGSTGTTRVSQVYTNHGNGLLSDCGVVLAGVASSVGTWADYNNDGKLDLLLMGDTGNGLLTVLYNNNGDGTFTDSGILLPALASGSAAWGDYDNSGQIDLLLTGFDTSYNPAVYLGQNTAATLNTAPPMLGGLTTRLSGRDVTLSWNPGKDDHTPSAGLHYNLRLGTVSGGGNLLAPMAEPTNGFRRVVRMGNGSRTNAWTVKDLPDGTYYWSVQAIDTAFAGGPFASEARFNVPSNPPTDISLNPAGVLESQPVGTTVGKLAAADLNADDTHVFALVAGPGDADNGAFTITADELKTAAVFDFESKNTYQIRVRATDPGGLYCEKALTVTVIDANEPPLAQCQDVTAIAGPTGTANASINNSSFDPDAGDAIALSQSPPGPYPVGTTLVTLTVTDTRGGSNSCVASVTVNDVTPPVIICPSSLRLDAQPGQCEAVLDYSSVVTASDNADPSPLITSIPPAGTLLPVGLTNVTITASDASGNSNSFRLLVSVYPAGTQVAGVDWTECQTIPEPQPRAWRSVACSAAGVVVAAVNGGPLYLSRDYGATWAEREGNRNWQSVACSTNGAKLAAVVFGGQIYTSFDFGETWIPREFNRNWTAIASSADGTKLVAAVYGGQIYISTDSGVSWTARENGRAWTSVACSADGIVMGAAVRGGQIFTSTDSGATWTPRDSSREWASITCSTGGDFMIGVVENGALYTSIDYGTNWTARAGTQAWSSVACSQYSLIVAAVKGGYLFTSTDLGQTWLERVGTNAWTSVAISPGNGLLFAAAEGDHVYSSWDSGATWDVAAMSRRWQSIASSADGTKLVAAANGGQIYTSQDSGTNWIARETSRAWSSVVSSTDGTKLVAVVNGGQNYTSTDSGASWAPRESSRSWSSVASSSDGTKLVAVANGGQIFSSSDSGSTWTPHESNRPWSAVASSADGAKLVAATMGGQIYLSTDAGLTWTPHDSNRSWAAVASSADGVKLVAVVTGGQIYTSTDSGGTWFARDSNRQWAAVASSADGTKLAAVDKNNGRIYLSTDSGLTWTAHASNRKWQTVASSADGMSLVAGVYGGRIYRSLPTVMPPAPPTILGATNRVVGATSPGGVVVEYAITATNECQPNVPVICTPPSGTTFPFGSTEVTCEAIDAFGVHLITNFTVEVVERPEQGGWRQALALDGVADCVSVPGLGLANTPLTIQLWAKRETTNTWDALVAQGTDSPGEGLFFAFSSDNRVVFSFSANDLYTTATYTDSAWHHWAATYDPGAGRCVYRDGVLVATDGNASPYTGTGPLLIGAIPWSADAAFDGSLDDVRIWNQARTGDQIRADMLHPMTGLVRELVAYWNFDVEAGGTIQDVTLKGHDGVVVGNASQNASTLPPWGYALSIDAAQGYAQVTIPPLASNYTVSAWVYLRSGGNQGGAVGALSAATCGDSVELLVHSLTSSSADPQYLELDRCGVFGGNTSSLTVPVNEWMHLAVTVSTNKEVRYFINGLDAGSWDASGQNLTIGPSITLGDNTTRRFDGMLDEVQIWNVAQSQAEIQARLGRPLTVSEPNLVARWSFDEGAGDAAFDSSANFLDATLVNEPSWVASTIGRAPTVSTLAPAGVVSDGTNATATLIGSVNPGVVPAATWFEWGDTTDYGNRTPNIDLESGIAAVACSNVLADLNAGQTYHYRVIAENCFGRVTGADQSLFPLLITLQGANPLLSAVGTPFVEPGFAVSGETQGLSSAVSGVVNVNQPGLYSRTYSAVNAFGWTATTTRSVRVVDRPALSLQPSVNVTSGTVGLRSLVNPNGLETVAWFEWGTTASYRWTNAAPSMGDGFEPALCSIELADLIPKATYHYRAAASNSLGVVYCPDSVFTVFSTDASLATLSISEVILDPVFTPDVTDYSARVPNGVGYVIVTPASADSGATIAVRVNGSAYTPVISGSPSGPLFLSMGANTIEVQVTAQDGVTQKTYAVAVTRAAPSAMLVGPSFPPPLGVLFNQIGTNEDGQIGWPQGKTWFFSGAALANQTPLFWGATNGGVKLSFNDDLYETNEVLVYQPALSGFATGVVAWAGQTLTPPLETNVYTRFVLSITNTATGVPIPLIDAASLGLPTNIGAVVRITPGLAWQAVLRFQASFNPNGPFEPALFFFANKVHTNRPTAVAYSSFGAGFYHLNTPPILTANNSLTVDRGTVATISAGLLSASDFETLPEMLRFTIAPQGEGGSTRNGVLLLGGTNLVVGDSFSQADVNYGRLYYAHSGNCETNDDFTFNVTDQQGGVTPTGEHTTYTFRIAIAQPNVPPVALDGSASTGLQDPYHGVLPATNGDCTPQTLEFRVVTLPTKGDLTLDDPTTGAFTYTPAAGQEGVDSFKFQVNDGVIDSFDPGTFTITISNQPPAAIPASVVTRENVACSGGLAATDPDRPPQVLSFSISSNPAKGTAVITDPATGAFTYTPNPGAIGADTFTFTASDGILASSPATLTIAIRPNLEEGDLLVSDAAGQIVLIDSTGAQGVVAAGNLLSEPRGVAFDPGGTVLVMDSKNGLLRIDPVTGAQAVLCSNTNFSTAPIGPWGIVLEPAGTILVADGVNGVGRVDPETGLRATLAVGDQLLLPVSLALAPSGDIIVGDAGAATGQSSRLVQVNATTGAQTLLSSGDHLLLPSGIAIDSSGDLLVTEAPTVFGGDADLVLKVNPADGEQTVLTASNLLAAPIGLALDPSGTAYVANMGSGSVITIDPVSGDQTLFSSGGLLSRPAGLAVVRYQAPPVERAEITGVSFEIPEVKRGVERITATITVTNTGNERATYYVWGSCLSPGSTGYDWALWPTSITLDAGTSGDVLVSWSPPAAVELGAYGFYAKLTSHAGGGFVFDDDWRASAFTVIDYVVSAQITDVSFDRTRVSPGAESITANVTVRNTGELTADFYVWGSGRAPTTGWSDWAPRPGVISIAPGESGVVPLSWSPPVDAEPGDYAFHAKVTADTAGATLLDDNTSEAAFSVYVPAVGAMITGVSFDRPTAVRGIDVLTASISIQNTGEIRAPFYVGSSCLRSGGTTWYGWSPARTKVVLDPGATASVPLTWLPPSGVEPGAYGFSTKVYKAFSGADFYDDDSRDASFEVSIPDSFASVTPYEIIVRAGSSLDLGNTADVQALIDECLASGVPAISLMVKDDETGELLYPSSLPETAPYGNYPASYIANLIELAHQNGLKVYAWIPMFKDSVLYNARSDYRMFYKDTASQTVLPRQDWVSPVNSEVTAGRLGIVQEVFSQFTFDGIRIDRSGYNSVWEDMSSAARTAFSSAFGVDPVDLTGPDDPHWVDWIDWRADRISAFNEAVRNQVLSTVPTASVGAYVFPDSASSGGYRDQPWSGQRYEDYGLLGRNLGISTMPLLYWQEGSASDVAGYVEPALRYGRQLATPTELIPVFDVTETTAWGGVLTEEEISQYLNLCGKLCQSNGVRRISYFYQGAWQSNLFARIRASYQGPVGAVTPGMQDFGEVSVGEVSERVFTLENVGTEGLVVTPSCDSPFSIVSPVGNIELAAGQSTNVTVAYSPDSQGPVSQRVRFQIAEDTIERSISGTGLPSTNAPTDISLDGGTIPENQPIGTSVGTFSATGPGVGDTFTYTLVSGSGDADNDYFSISGSNLQSAAYFNYESRNSYSIRVRATDQGGLWFEKSFTIAVLNVNEPPTEIALTTLSVPENQPPGSLVGAFITTDEDIGDTFTYALVVGPGDDDNASFTISGDKLLMRIPLDYELQKTCSFRVGVTDHAGLHFERSFVLSVTDVAEKPVTPVNLRPANGALDQPLLLTLEASTFSDPDTGDTHAASQWLVKRSADSVIAFDSGEDATSKTSCEIPPGKLTYSTAYTWQVRYKDSSGLWSDYSTPTAFSTLAPTLAATIQGNSIVFIWSTNAPDFVLVSATNLTADATWTPVMPLPVADSGQNVVTNIPSAPGMFYRLMRQ